MAGTFLNYPFDEELFDYRWRNEPDVVKTALLESGAMVVNGDIASQISNGSNYYTVPFYRNLADTEPQNYDGQTDIEVEETKGDTASGIVWGRSHGWKERDFVRDFNSGADPMGLVVSQVGRYWARWRQRVLAGILEACFACDGGDYATEWALHTTDLSASGGTVAAGNKLAEASLSEAAQKACGDNAPGMFGLAIMHSKCALNLAKLDLLEFRRYTDPAGITRQLPIADAEGYTIVVDDSLGDPEGGKYTTYLLGHGAVNYAPAPVQRPSELARDGKTNGGQTELYTRLRETMLPNGFTYVKQDGDGVSPTDEQLREAARWKPVYDPKAIPMVRLVTNG